VRFRPHLCGPTQSDLAEFLRDIRAIPLLTPEEEIDLSSRYRRRGCTASRERLICSNLKLVVYVAQRYTGLGVPIQDLVECGNIGLLEAVERFDPDRGARFATYAVWWIRQGIMQALAREGHVVRIPERKRRAIRAVRRAMERLASELGRAATSDEIASETGLSALELARVAHVPAIHAIDDETSGTSGSLPAPGDAPDQASSRREMRTRLRAALRTLPGKEAEVVRRRFGLEGRAPQSTADIGRELGMPTGAAQRLLNQALGRLQRTIDHEPAALVG
jgi:RNA polymerase primary sigma factor